MRGSHLRHRSRPSTWSRDPSKPHRGRANVAGWWTHRLRGLALSRDALELGARTDQEVAEHIQWPDRLPMMGHMCRDAQNPCRYMPGQASMCTRQTLQDRPGLPQRGLGRQGHHRRRGPDHRCPAERGAWSDDRTGPLMLREGRPREGFFLAPACDISVTQWSRTCLPSRMQP